MVDKYTRHFVNALFTRRNHPAVSGDDAVVLVYDDGINESKLTKAGAELVYLLRRMGAGVVDIRHEFIDFHQFHVRGRLHRTNPHSANFSNPPMRAMYSLAMLTISAYGLPSTYSSPIAHESSTGVFCACALSQA